MPEAEVEVKICSEAILQHAMIEIAERALEEHGILINSVYLNWDMHSAISGDKHGCVASCEMQTTYTKREL